MYKLLDTQSRVSLHVSVQFMEMSKLICGLRVDEKWNSQPAYHALVISQQPHGLYWVMVATHVTLGSQ